MIIVAYTTDEEAEQIKADKAAEGYTLVAVSNITEGNFLRFEEPGWTPPVHEPALTAQVAALQEEMTNTQVALAETYEQLLASQDETTTLQVALVDVYEKLLLITEGAD